MEATRVRQLRFLTLQVVGAIAVVHLVVGGQELLRIAAQGLLGTYLTRFVAADPRPVLFVVSALVMLAGVVLVAWNRLPYRTAYQLGLLVLAGYLVGWVGWHTVLDHGLALSGGAPATPDGHSHAGLVDTLRSHYFDPILATFAASARGTPGTGQVLLSVLSVTLELIGVVLLAVLLRVDPRAARTASNPFATEDSPNSE